MNLILIAPPAAGKGTLASRLVQEHGLVSISAGELLRQIDPNSKIGKEIQGLLSSRQLVRDDLLKEMFKERLMKDDVKNGFILDGYPRHMVQVYDVNDILSELNLKIDYVVVLNVDEKLALKRTLGRRICPKCKKTYNILTGVCTPKKDNLCDECNVELISRSDDNEETLRKGLEVYNTLALDVIKYYKEKDKDMVIELDSNGSANDTYNEFISKVGL